MFKREAASPSAAPYLRRAGLDMDEGITPCKDINAATAVISSEHPYSSPDAMRHLAMSGLTGSSDIVSPYSFVSLASASTIFDANSTSIALAIASIEGGDMKSKLRILSMPRLFSCSTTGMRSHLCNSGTTVGASVWYPSSVYTRKHLPGLFLPALPARCTAELLLIFRMMRLSIAVAGSNTLSLTYPLSTTYTIPSMVMDDSAMLVATTIFLQCFGGGSNASICLSSGMPE
mmetsp:Transcript_28038/g.71446  ORF Transcript_28038/g.71446 Transcript_28038/m.71446 type:complete len:232 (+) Transcript_28038:598-1293(+)